MTYRWRDGVESSPIDLLADAVPETAVLSEVDLRLTETC